MFSFHAVGFCAFERSTRTPKNQEQPYSETDLQPSNEPTIQNISVINQRLTFTGNTHLACRQNACNQSVIPTDLFQSIA